MLNKGYMTNAAIEHWKRKFTFLYKKIIDWYTWNKIFFKETKSQKRLLRAIVEAQLLANAKGKQYYVLMGPSGGYVSMSSAERKRMQHAKLMDRSIDVMDMLEDAVFIAKPENLNYVTSKK